MARTLKNQPQTLSGSPSPNFTNYTQAPIEATRAPTTADTGYPFGQIWVDTSTGIIYGLGAISGGSATWNLMSPGASDVDTLTGDAGGAISPAGGNITLAGGTNMATSGAGSTITFNLDAAITLATSVSSPIYTVAAATDLNINSAAGQDIIIQMGDAAGANKVSFEDSASAEVFSIDSNGAIGTLSGLTVTGAFTQTAGVVSISEDNSANAVGIANGTTARAVSIASSAAAHTVTLGSVTGAASTDIQYGTGNFTIDGGATGNVTIGASMTSGVMTIGGSAQTGSLDLGPSTAAQTITLGVNNGAKIINMGNGVDGNTISIGNGINTSAQIINIANGASAANSTVNILSGVGTAGAGILALGNNTRVTTIGVGDIAPAAARTVTICGGDSAQNDTLSIMSDNPSANAQTVTILGGVPTGGTQTLNLLTQTGQAGTINIGNGVGMANTINMGGTGASLIRIGTIQSGGSINIGSALTTGTMQIGGTLQTGLISLAPSQSAHLLNIHSEINTGAQTVNLQSGNSGADATVNILSGDRTAGISTLNVATGTGGKTVNIASGAGANLVTIGSSNTTSSLDLLCGTGNFSLEGDTTTTYDISGTGVNTGTITIGGGTGAQTLNMMNSTGVKTVNLASGAAANVVTIGSTTGAASLTLQAGTGEITVTGTVKEIDAEFLEASGDEITSFSQSPILQSAVNTGAAPTGATGDVNIMYCQQGVLMEQFMIGAGQTIIAPRMDATGLSVALDQTVTEGVEYNFGAARTNSRHAFTIGTSPAFFFEVQFQIEDMSGASPFVIGFRKSEANNAVLANYTDYAAIGMNSGSSATEIVLMTELNSAGQTITNTTDLWGGDNTANTLRVLVSAAGVVTYTINGAAPSVTAAYTFDTPDVVCPFIHLIQGADLSECHLISMKCGFQA